MYEEPTMELSSIMFLWMQSMESSGTGYPPGHPPPHDR
jgi:hypothetical protein